MFSMTRQQFFDAMYICPPSLSRARVRARSLSLSLSLSVCVFGVCIFVPLSLCKVISYACASA